MGRLPGEERVIWVHTPSRPGGSCVLGEHLLAKLWGKWLWATCQEGKNFSLGGSCLRPQPLATGVAQKR